MFRKTVAQILAFVLGGAIGALHALLTVFGTFLIMVLLIILSGLIPAGAEAIALERPTPFEIFSVGCMGSLFFFVFFDKKLLINHVDKLERRLNRFADNLLNKIEGETKPE